VTQITILGTAWHSPRFCGLAHRPRSDRCV